MDSELFQWFLCGCYLLGGISIGYWYGEWRNKRNKRTGTGRWDYSNRRFTDDGEYS